MMSIQQCLAREKWKQDHLIRSLVEDVVFSQQKRPVKIGLFDQFLYELGLELQEVKRNQHQAIDRLCNLRKNLRDRLIFRQKSRQIWTYFGFQTTILSLIYLGILIYVCREMGFTKHKKIIFLSLSFYFSGLLCVYFLIKGKKWVI